MNYRVGKADSKLYAGVYLPTYLQFDLNWNRSAATDSS